MRLSLEFAGMRHILAACWVAPLLIFASSANAQLGGTPGNGPLTPGGPRQGLGPPSITDNVPDLRLRSDGGGIPGAGPPIDYGAAPRAYGRPQARAGRGGERYATSGRHCRTPQRVCVLAAAAPFESGCSCQTSGRGRTGGYVVP